MGILRADLLTHSQLPSANGSVELDGTSDFIQVPASSAWDIGRANLAHKSVTIEWWIYQNSVSGSYSAFNLNHTTGLVAAGSSGLYTIYGGGQTLINEGILEAATADRWYHYALVIHGGPAATLKSIYLYRDGKLSGAGKINSNYGIGDSSNVLCIGDKASGDRSVNGYISNFRWSDEVVYNSEFTVPKFKLKALPSTLLLCCQSSTSATEAAVSISGSLTASGNATHSSFGPSLKNDITDTGVVFDGFGSFATSTYMVPPKGKTTERNRGRGISFGGDNNTTSILFVDIQSQGNGQDFGDLTAATIASPGACASSTRGLYGGGTPSNTNVIGFITIATTANASDFGDLTQARRQLGGCSNDTRGLFGSGRVSDPVNTIDFVTIATTGDASDFGDVTTAARYLGSTSSTTRGFWFGGNAPTATNVINFVTIATTGDASDFGDLTEAKPYPTGCSSSTRAISLGGMVSAPNYVNTIEFFTMASTGNATDFGDCIEPNGNSSGMSNGIRGVRFAGAVVSGSYTNSIDFINIATTGNASDFGDFTTAGGDGAGTSDSHGGLS